MLIDSSSTHNFINFKLAKLLNCFIYLAPEFQVLIVIEGTINCPRKCHIIKLIIVEYLLYSPMIAIQICGAEYLLGFQWL